jgi:hypothetical protein
MYIFMYSTHYSCQIVIKLEVSGHTDMTKLTVTFHNFVNVTKNQACLQNKLVKQLNMPTNMTTTPVTANNNANPKATTTDNGDTTTTTATANMTPLNNIQLCPPGLLPPHAMHVCVCVCVCAYITAYQH